MPEMIDIEEIMRLIPHRYPFLMIDRVVDIKEGEYIKAYKNISINESCFRGHFPNLPIFPGVFISECMAQAACVLIKKSLKDLKATQFYVTNIKVRFLKSAIPGDRLDIVVKAIKIARVGGIFETEASVDNTVIAKGEMTFACK